MVKTEQTRASDRADAWPAARGPTGVPAALRKAPGALPQAPATPPRSRRLAAAERERQIVAGAAAFFARRGLEAQTRELAAELGIAHPLLYHYFPTKRLLIERVYDETIAGRWSPRWETLLDDASVPAAERLHAFYRAYLDAILTPEWLRILVHSGLADGLIPDRYFALLRQRLFPRLLRLVRGHAGSRSRAAATPREEALLLGFHGGLIYHFGIWPIVYRQPHAAQHDAALAERCLRDRIDGLLQQAASVVGPVPTARRAAPARGAARPLTKAAIGAPVNAPIKAARRTATKTPTPRPAKDPVR